MAHKNAFVPARDVMLHKAPYWSFTNYDNCVDASVRVSFLSFVEDQHKESRANGDFEGTMLYSS